MKIYTKIIVAALVLATVSSVGFSTAFGYGGGSSRRSDSRPVITQAPQGRVLGASTLNFGNLSQEERAKLIKDLQDQLAKIVALMNILIANGTLK